MLAVTSDGAKDHTRPLIEEAVSCPQKVRLKELLQQHTFFLAIQSVYVVHPNLLPRLSSLKRDL